MNPTESIVDCVYNPFASNGESAPKPLTSTGRRGRHGAGDRGQIIGRRLSMPPASRTTSGTGGSTHSPIRYLTYVIWTFINEPFVAANALAYAAAFLVTFFVLAINLASRLVLREHKV